MKFNFNIVHFIHEDKKSTIKEKICLKKNCLDSRSANSVVLELIISECRTIYDCQGSLWEKNLINKNTQRTPNNLPRDHQ